MKITLSRRRAVLSVVTAAAVVVPAGALTTAWAGTETAPTVSPAPDMATALHRDLGLTPEAASVRLEAETVAAKAESDLAAKLGSSFGGAWFSEAGNELVVATTDPSERAAIEAAGARPQVVGRSLAALEAARARLDRASAPAGVTRWHADPQTNTVVIVAEPGAEKAAAAYAAAAGLPAAAVTVEKRAGQMNAVAAVDGGDAYITPRGGDCSVGFGVVGGYVTAGHCGKAGQAARAADGSAQGTFRGSSYPGNDYAWVELNANWQPSVWVNRYPSRTVVGGARVSSINSSVCRSGMASGWRCGKITDKNVTIHYQTDNVNVSGLTLTNACAEPGDSGGPFLSGWQAQGVAVAASGNCSSGGETAFQPLQEILDKYNLTLLTANPATVHLNCESGLNQYLCTATPAGDAPVTLQWKVNNVVRADWNGRRSVTGSCTTSTRISVTARNAYASTTQTWASCRSGPWL
ncbi:alpha-lytic protease prodomain-containing protein [Actinoplanes sp. LDG1-06]|uniref:Alpha-lytic protease prodomain-containing protein n=1 Tax=Paractinoplanes ovalisporus TaxID=2810368 RepID=A0ABS2ALY5_9ACTN|nr:S1 family peptidase [Actinoplanes ovalisporus]MBM2620879.1 alpha-lytic protease prodomain-containing protein [Actinoplanes ovalisporus]